MCSSLVPAEGCVMARSRAMIRATMPSICSMLFFFDGFQLSAASFSMLTLPAIQRSTGWPAWAILPPRNNSRALWPAPAGLSCP
jgi:hypothetical protein